MAWHPRLGYVVNGCLGRFVRHDMFPTILRAQRRAPEWPSLMVKDACPLLPQDRREQPGFTGFRTNALKGGRNVVLSNQLIRAGSEGDIINSPAHAQIDLGHKGRPDSS